MARVAQSNADQVGALVQEVCVGLEGSLAVELRYQCKVHNDKVAKCTDCALTKWHSENFEGAFSQGKGVASLGS